MHYDGEGDKVTQTDALGRVNRWEFDRLGRVISRTLPVGQPESNTYGEMGNPPPSTATTTTIG